MMRWLVVAPTLVLALFSGCSHGHAQALQEQQGQAQRQARAEQGKVLMAQYQCGSCHTIPGVPAARGQGAPTLMAWSRRSYIAGRLPNRPDLLAQWISAPQALVPGTAMPDMGVSPSDAQAMAAYLFSLEE